VPTFKGGKNNNNTVFYPNKLPELKPKEEERVKDSKRSSKESKRDSKETK